MRAIPGWLTVGSLLFVLAGCAMPYYPTPPARVYYPLRLANIYYPPQRASLYDPRASLSPDRSQSRSSKARHRRPPAAEQNQGAGQMDLRHGAAPGSDWIDPEP